jgi:hypothetical protein
MEVVIVFIGFSVLGVSCFFYLKQMFTSYQEREDLEKEIENIKRDEYNNINYEFGDNLSCGNTFICKINGNFLYISYNHIDKCVDYHKFNMEYIKKEAEKNINTKKLIDSLNVKHPKK